MISGLGRIFFFKETMFINYKKKRLINLMIKLKASEESKRKTINWVKISGTRTKC